jgi:type II secretory pathway pseudopilin PulG
MIVVAIISILAAIGISLLRKHVFGTRSVEALSTVQAIRAAQESWKADTMRYMDVSTTLKTYYPRTAPTPDKVPWNSATGNNKDNWRVLDVRGVEHVQGVYATVAGLAGAEPSDEAFEAFDNLPADYGTPVGPWYLIQAKTDADGDGSPTLFLATSFTGAVMIQE